MKFVYTFGVQLVILELNIKRQKKAVICELLWVVRARIARGDSVDFCVISKRLAWLREGDLISIYDIYRKIFVRIVMK